MQTKFIKEGDYLICKRDIRDIHGRNLYSQGNKYKVESVNPNNDTISMINDLHVLEQSMYAYSWRHGYFLYVWDNFYSFEEWRELMLDKLLD